MTNAALRLSLLLLTLPPLCAAPPPPAKIHPQLLARLAAAPDAEADYLLILEDQADLTPAATLRTKAEKGALVFALLNEAAQRSQPAVRRALVAQGAKVESFWVQNCLRVRGPAASAFAMAERADVARLDPNPVVALRLPPPDTAGRAPEAIEAIEPGVTQIRAPEAWARGFTGQGIVVGGNDTGYRWTHAVLKNGYRGWNGAAADHNYNWHDAIHSGGGSCGANALAPCDDQGHGTHTMGTMVGTDGASNQTGVAPGARWIGCRNMDQGNGTPATYMECLQWFIAPTNLLNQNPDPAQAPDVINNSWGCPASEGCATDTLRVAVESVRAAGIVVVVSAGNSGSACATVVDPPAIYQAAFSVGALATSGTAIASFSSRGPVTVDGSNRLKPEVSAPGSSVRSATRTSDTAYASLSGTSMAGPHVVGAVALLLSAHPQLVGNPDAVQLLLSQTTLRITSTQTCGGVSGGTIPNNTFGWGRIDAFVALGLDDPDGDGMADWQELLAGTNGASAASALRVTSLTPRAGGGMDVTFPSVIFKSYRLERATDLAAPSWQPVGSVVTSNGGPLVLSDPAPAGPRQFYRVVVVP